MNGRPRRLLLLGGLVALVVAPLGVAALAHARDFSLAGVRWNLGWGLVVPLPGATAWVLFALFGLAMYLAVAAPTYVVLRRSAAPTRNLATLLALAASLVVAFVVLVTWLDLWRP